MANNNNLKSLKIIVFAWHVFLGYDGEHLSFTNDKPQSYHSSPLPDHSITLIFFFFFFFNRKKGLLSSDLVSRVNNLVGYNLPESYLGICLSIFTINITLDNKNIKKHYTIKCYVYMVDHTQLKIVQIYLAYCCWCLIDWLTILFQFGNTLSTITIFGGRAIYTSFMHHSYI